jgi:tyrosyl-tRNA synthetase
VNIQDKLNHLAELQAQADKMRSHYEGKRESIIPPEIKQQLSGLDAEYQAVFDALNSGISELTAEIKADILQGGVSVKGERLHAIWVKGRVSWDTKGLDGYLVAHPEMAAFRKEGEPSVTIRVVKI